MSDQVLSAPFASTTAALANVTVVSETNEPVRVGVVGCGYWGPNLMRNFSSCSQTKLTAVCDLEPSRLSAAIKNHSQARAHAAINQLLADPSIEAVAIATPVSTHFRLAAAALEAGKHVWIEKPLAATACEAEQLTQLAAERGLTLMVDHTYIYSPAIRKIREIIDSGELGDIYYVDSVRINLGLLQHDINVLWDLATHDLSIVDHLLGRLPRSLAAFGACHTVPDIEDVAYMNLDFGSNLLASFHVNWLSPVKVRHFIIGGSLKSLVYNDLDPVEPVKLYDRSVAFGNNLEGRKGMLLSYRTGDIWSPHIDRSEPLQNAVRHFAECVRRRQTPLTDGNAGLRIVRILEAAQRSIKAQGGRITL